MNTVEFNRDITDNLVLPFEVPGLGVRGRVVRLGQVIDEIISQHDYPECVSGLLSQMVALSTMLGAALKFDGKFILQTTSDGPLSMLVADFTSPGHVRGYARFDRERIGALEAGAAAPDDCDVLGSGHLAMTIDPGGDMERYQGIVAINSRSLAATALDYFHQSEQIPTSLLLAAGPVLTGGGKARAHWRAGAIMIQHLPQEGGISPLVPNSGDVPGGEREQVTEDGNWTKARALLETTRPDELLDPLVSPEELLYRLFHEDGAVVYKKMPVDWRCSCSRERIGGVIKGFDDDARAGLVESGQISATCEFCSTRYAFTPEEMGIKTAAKAK